MKQPNKKKWTHYYEMLFHLASFLNNTFIRWHLYLIAAVDMIIYFYFNTLELHTLVLTCLKLTVWCVKHLRSIVENSGFPLRWVCLSVSAITCALLSHFGSGFLIILVMRGWKGVVKSNSLWDHHYEWPLSHYTIWSIVDLKILIVQLHHQINKPNSAETSSPSTV